MFSNLHSAIIFRVFASEGESARKFSLIFWVELKTKTEKSSDTENL